MLPFNTAKCKSLHLGPRNRENAYKICNHAVEQVREEKDLGVVVDEELKFRKQAADAVTKANRVLGTIRRSFANLDIQTIPLLYKTLVRPLLEYGNAIWGPHNKEDQRMVERVQRRATKLVAEIRELPYAERLEALKLPSLQYRRRRGDVLLMYQVANGLLGLSWDDFFEQPTTRTTRGHPLKVAKPHAQTRARRNHWSIRTINDWNTLPASIITARTLNEFKNGLDKYWYRERYIHL